VLAVRIGGRSRMSPSVRTTSSPGVSIAPSILNISSMILLSSPVSGTVSLELSGTLHVIASTACRVFLRGSGKRPGVHGVATSPVQPAKPNSASRAEGQEIAMTERPTDPNRPDSVRPAAPCRVVADSEYRTAYIETFQIRIPARLHERLCEWAKQERGSLTDLVVDILEEAVRRRGAEAGTDVPRDE
jgi:hypothetical protein